MKLPREIRKRANLSLLLPGREALVCHEGAHYWAQRDGTAMSQQIDEKTADLFRSISKQLAQCSEVISSIRVSLLLAGHVTGAPIDAIDRVDEAIGGLAYMFTPQSEWTGGDSSDPKNFKSTLPHILR